MAISSFVMVCVVFPPHTQDNRFPEIFSFFFIFLFVFIWLMDIFNGHLFFRGYTRKIFFFQIYFSRVFTSIFEGSTENCCHFLLKLSAFTFLMIYWMTIQLTVICFSFFLYRWGWGGAVKKVHNVSSANKGERHTHTQIKIKIKNAADQRRRR